MTTTTATLADFNPALATELGLPLATDFTAEDLAAVSAAVLADSGPAVSPATRMAEEAVRAVKIDAAKVDPVLLALFEELSSRAVAEKITATEAIKRVMLAHPTATRIAIKHTAALVGINPLSARNTFDKFSKA